MYFSRVRIRPGNKALTILAEKLKHDSYAGHRILWTLFPDHAERTFLFREEIAREQLGPAPAARGAPVYYVVSQTPPVPDNDGLFIVETKPYKPQLHVGQRLVFDCRVNPVVCRQGKKHDVAMDAQRQFLLSWVEAFQLKPSLPVKPEKSDYKNLLLARGGEALDRRLVELLASDTRYAERLQHIASLADKLEWAIKAQVDAALEDWLKRQGERLGFEIVLDDDGLSKLQNSAYLWHPLPKKGDKPGFSAVDFCGELEVTDAEKFQQAVFHGIGRAKAFGCGLLLLARA